MKNLTLMLLGCALCACALGNEQVGEAPDTGPENDLISDFFDDFEAARYSRALLHATALDEAAGAAPNDGELALSRGLAHLWHAAEAGRDPTQDGAALGREAAQLSGWFQRAKALRPSDARIDCWGGVSTVQAGRALGDDALVQQGLAWIDAGVAAYPEFNLFCRALAYEDLPVADPDYARAVEALFQVLDVCFGEPVDREQPDITKYLHQATRRGRKRVCWNGPLAPHNAEGFYLYFGDLLVKQGATAVAKIMYRNATRIREYRHWPYKALLEERLGTNLEARAALYRDDDPDNDPLPGGNDINRNCAYCHAVRAAE